MFLHARQIIRRRLKAAAAKAKEAAIVAVETPPEKADQVLEQLAADEARMLEKVRAHFADRAAARQAQIAAARKELAKSIAQVDPPAA